MGMTKLTSQVTQEQMEAFFRKSGKKFDECKVVIRGDYCLIVELKWRGKLESWYTVTDQECKSDNWEKITSNDWISYLQELFGEDYEKEYPLSSYPNPFIMQLSTEEVYSLLLEKIRIENLPTFHSREAPKMTEEPAVVQGTRRFKMMFFNTVICKPIYYEFVLEPYLPLKRNWVRNTQVSPAWEEEYVAFMVKKFGPTYILYAMNREEEICFYEKGVDVRTQQKTMEKIKRFLMDLLEGEGGAQ